MPKQVIIIDAKNLLFRHNAVNGNLSRGDGFPTGALYGCLNSMIALSQRFPDTPFVWIWDGDGETWRHKHMRDHSYLYAPIKDRAETREPAIHKKVKPQGYKANRLPKEIFDMEKKHDRHKSKWPEDGKARGIIQIPILKLVLDGCGFRNYTVPGLEGDDLIAIVTRYLLRHTRMDVIIHSGDKDFYQLMGDRVRILSRIEKGKPLFVHRSDVKNKFGVSVRDWAKFRAWMGDPSDNIPHLPHVGPSVASKMIKAGLDPSMNLHAISSDKFKKFARFFPEGVDRCWPFVQSNYKLCKLVNQCDDERLPLAMQQRVKELLKHFHTRRDKHKINSSSYRRVGYLFMQYDLKTILSKRDQLWAIP